MSAKKPFKNRLLLAIFGCFFALINIFGSFVNFAAPAYAEPEVFEEITTEAEPSEPDATDATDTTDTTDTASDTATDRACKDQLGAIGWLVCPTTGKIAEAVDWLYDKIEDILIINPISTEDSSPIYNIWKYFRDITNIIFIIYLLIIIYSQITGMGINNYGIKKALPKLIVAVILVNLSFIICSLAVEVSNIIGQSLRGVFTSIEEASLAAGTSGVTKISFSSMYSYIAGGTAAAIAGGAIAIETGAIWMLIPTVLAAIAAVVSGLITIALRQTVVALLIMIAPLAFVANILPNTEEFFKKWKKLLTRMLVFYPLFSLLFGASSLAGWAIISSAKDGFAVLLGMAVQIFPLLFSWSLMKMSGTVLGTINDKLRGIAAKPIAVNRAWADSRRAQSRAYHLQYGNTPYTRLQRYLENRKELRTQNTTSLNKLRQNDANIYAQRKITGGHDGSTATEANKGNLKPNRYTRIAKDLSNSNLASTTASLDTTHLINNYGGYYLSPKTREIASIAKKSGDATTLSRLAATDRDYQRDVAGAKNFLELSRAQMTAENDSEADFNFMVGEYLKASYGRDKSPEGFQKYRHFITASAGGLGEVGETRVLGKIIAKAAAVESNQRRDINIIANKFPPDKRSFRNMVVGYYVDDDGFATDKDGRSLGEKYRGEFLQNSPEKLVMWDQFDENGAYFDWKDSNGTFVTRIHKSDKSAIKELLSNFDAPINDPINNLYGILSGISENPDNQLTGHIGLDAYRTTVGRAILGASFKEKNACFSPMVAEMVKKGYIQNYAQENLAYLDSFNKATKPGAFNTQDHDAVKMLTEIMDPRKWEEVFPTDLIRGFRNVNGEEIYGIRYDENGNKIKVSAKDATREELMERVKEKFIFPAAQKMMLYMSRQTPNTVDNQKAGTVKDWRNLKEVFDTYYGKDGGDYGVSKDPYEQEGDTSSMAYDIKQRLYVMENGEKHYIRRGNGHNDRRKESGTPRPNHHVAAEEMYINSNNDPDALARDFVEYCANYPELSRAARDFNDYMMDHQYSATTEEIHEFIIELLDSYTNLD